MGAYGAFSFPHLPFQRFPVGARLGSVTVLPGGSNVHYVRSTGAADYDPPELAARIHTTVNSALAECRSGRGDTVIVLEGHTENISAADAWSNLVAGTRIIGRGYGTMRPTFTWTAAAGTILGDVANVWIENCIFNTAGARGSTTALTVTVAFPVTAAGFHFINNEVCCGVDADQLTTDVFTLSADADDAVFADNYIFGALAAEITSVITTAGACDRLKIVGNHISCAVATAATGVLLDLDNAAIIENDIIGNRLENKTASSKFVIDPHATSTGCVERNTYYVGDSGTGPASLGFATFTTTYKFNENYCVTAVSASGILCPAADS